MFLSYQAGQKKFKWVSSSVKVDYGAVVSFHHGFFFYISRFMYLRFFDIGTSSVLGLSSWSNHLDFQRSQRKDAAIHGLVSIKRYPGHCS